MKNYLTLFLCGCGLLLAGCKNSDTSEPVVEDNQQTVILQAQVDSLQARNVRLEEETRLRHEFLEEYITLVNQTLADLDALTQREGMLRQIRLDVQAGEAGSSEIGMGTIEQRVQDNLTAIERYIEESKKERDELGRQRDRLLRMAREREVHVSNLDLTIQQLNGLIEEKEQTILSLREEAQRMLTRIADLSHENTVLVAENTELRQAYYIVGTRTELEGHGIIDRRGGFLSLGRKTHLSEYDVRRFVSTNVERDKIFLGQDLKRYQILSDHRPHTSLYQFEEQDNKVYLAIANAEDFWKVSRYLVVEVRR
ncbi:MAG: hypothetical protein ACE5G0_07885 [Rhodothermales bacterium]